MIPKISFYVRICKNGKRKYIVANTGKQAEDGIYCLRYEVNGKRVWDSVGRSLLNRPKLTQVPENGGKGSSLIQ